MARSSATSAAARVVVVGISSLGLAAGVMARLLVALAMANGATMEVEVERDCGRRRKEGVE
ncbi:uncharacterized protein G2W53_034929 [Senna tora]|uniref:Uncharacterized protein n=1 Tax=Senna tora TaxID=362788 RepID=A0A834SRE5_9FABA|nr:uncharacterized protein G2W53_034929 [Senna tora]